MTMMMVSLKCKGRGSRVVPGCGGDVRPGTRARARFVADPAEHAHRNPVVLRALVVVLCLVGGGAGGAEDTVYLKDGKALRGRIFDYGGNRIFLHGRFGRQGILKSEIARIEIGEGDPSRGNESDQDRLILTDGREIAGEVRIAPDGRYVVRLGQGAEAMYPPDAVLRWIRKGGEVDDGGVTSTRELARRIDQLIADLPGATGVRADQIEADLKRMGIFSAGPVEKALPKATGEAAARLRRVLSFHRLHTLVSSSMENEVKDIYARLSSRDPNTKKDVIKEAYYAGGEDAIPLLRFKVLDEGADPEVSAFVIELLRRIGRSRDLVELYEQSTGPMQLAVAVALGENGILVGVPTLIEGLTMENRDVRKLSLDKLEAYTGQTFGFEVDGAKAERLRSVAEWGDWWDRHRKEILEQSRAILEGPDLGRDLSRTRRRSQELWRRANDAWEKGELDDAEAAYRRAVRTDASNPTAALSLAIFLYRTRREFRESGELLTRLADGRIPVPEGIRKLVHFHLGEVHRLCRHGDEARVQYERALAYDPGYVEARIAIGDLQFAQFLESGSSLRREDRETYLNQTLSSYREALKQLERYSSELRVLRRDEIPVGEQIPFQVRDYNTTLAALKGYLKLQRARILLAMARVAMAREHLDQAVSWLEEAREWDPENIATRRLLAHAYERAGEKGKARQEVQWLLGRDPDDASLKEALRRLGG